MKPLGIHYIAEFYKCNREILDDPQLIESMLTEAAEISGVTIIKPFFHQFAPQGVSGIIVISESHFAIHTWPEHGYAAVDLFSCGEFMYTKALEHIKSKLVSDETHVSRLQRGFVSKNTDSCGIIYDRLESSKTTSI